MKKIYLISVLLLSMVLAGCENSSEYRDFLDTQVQIENSDVVFTAAGGTGTIEVATEGFTSTCDQSWCTITTNGKIITVNAIPNVSISGRTARVTVKSGDKVNYVSVSQYGLILTVDRNVAIDGKGEILRIPYESLVALTVQSSESWLIASIDGDEIVLTAEPNTSMSQTRTATVSILDGLTTITVTQGTNYLTMDTYSATFDGRGGTVKIGYDDSNSITVLSNAAWLTATVVGDSIVLTAVATPNLTTSRSTTVTVYVLDGQTTINVTQEKYLTYEAYLGTYTMSYSISYSNPTPTRTLPVTLEIDPANPTTRYIVKGILADSYTDGELYMVYSPTTSNVSWLIQLIYASTTDFWCLGWSITNTTQRNTTFGMVSTGTDISGNLKFSMVDNGLWATGAAGFIFRTYTAGTTSNSVNIPGKDGQHLIAYPSFEKQ
jgi:hypothetical protein